jgi:hypothetical protein
MKFELIIIIVQGVFLLLLSTLIINQRKKITLLKNDFTNQNPKIGGADLFENITKSKLLYKDLLKEIHPDRFIGNEELLKKAEFFSLELGKNQNSYRNLLRIALEAQKSGMILSSNFTKKYEIVIQNESNISS